MRAKALLPAFLILMASLIVLAPPAYAASPIVQAKGAGSDYNITCTANCTMSTALFSIHASGELLAVAITLEDNNGGGCFSLSAPAITDSSGDSFTQITVSSCQTHIVSQQTWIFSGLTSSTACNPSCSLVVHINGHTGGVAYGSIEVLEVSGVATTVVSASNIGNCVPTCTAALSSGLTYSGGPAFVLVAIGPAYGCTVTCAAATTGYTLYPVANAPSCQTSFLGCAEYGNDTSIVTFPTTASWTYSSASNPAYWEESAALWGLQTPVTVVAACNFFQLQCWLYPLFFVGVFMVFVMGMAVAGRVPSKSQTFLILATLTIAFTLEVMMGMVNIMFPLILAALGILYALRQR